MMKNIQKVLILLSLNRSPQPRKRKTIRYLNFDNNLLVHQAKGKNRFGTRLFHFENN